MEYHVMIFYDWENDKSNIDWLYKYIAYPSVREYFTYKGRHNCR